MKTFNIIILAALLGSAVGSHANTINYNFNSGFANGGVIPDGNTTGLFDTRTLSGISDGTILDVNVFLNFSGGYNSDLYAYLTHSSGFSVLLNRVGRTSANTFGYGDSGLNVTLDDSAANGDIHSYQLVSGYASLITGGNACSPDGRNVNPLVTLDTDARSRMLNQFNGLNLNGNWTLFVADLSSGDQSTLVNWGLEITAVPDAGSSALLTGLALLGTILFSRATNSRCPTLR